MFEQELVNDLDVVPFLLCNGVVPLGLVEVFKENFEDEGDYLF